MEGNSPGECQQENAESFPEESEQKKKHDEDGFHVKGGGDSQPYNGHRWGLGCCHYVRQGAEEDTFRFLEDKKFIMIRMYSYYFLKRYPNDRFSSRLQHLIESSYVLQGGINLSSSSLQSSSSSSGGIYIASNLPNSSKAWDCRVDVNAIGRCSCPS